MRDALPRELLTRSIERSRGSLPTHEKHVLNLKEDRPRLPAPKYREEQKMAPHDEEETRWAGVFIAVVGVTLMALSFALGGSSF